MVKNNLFLLIAFFVANTASAFDAEISSNLPNIVQIQVTETGVFSDQASSSSETKEDCQAFTLDQIQAANFFKISRRATRRDYTISLMPSKCSVSGNLTTSEGHTGRWYIDRARRGLIYLPHDHSNFYFYCSECTDAAFYEACDIDCIHSEE